MEKSLTIKQEKAVQAFIRLGDKSAAYREAYDCSRMKDASVHRKAVELFQNVKLTARIADIQQKAADRNNITIDTLIKEWSKMAFTDFSEIMDFQKGTITLTDFRNLTPAQRACIKKFKFRTEKKLQYNKKGEPVMTPVDLVEIELYDKQVALTNLGKHIGFYEVDNKQKRPVVNLGDSPVEFK